jgi:hypothetical protein
MLRYFRSSGTVIVITIFFFMIVGGVHQARAQSEASQITLSESELLFSGLVGETVQRTVTLSVTGSPVFGLQIIVPDLVDPVTKSVILSDRISISPADISMLSGNTVMTLTINGIDRSGTFEGDVILTYPEQDTGEDLKLHLVAEIRAVPAVDADVNSKNLSLFVEPALWDFPFGRPTLTQDSPLLGEVALSLIQSGDNRARITNARVLAMQSSQGRTLPEGAVSVVSSFPVELSAKDAATLSIEARGNNLPAGEYNGTLLINVEDQPGPVQIPLKVQVKDGPILAFILLAAGPLVGILFFYWNKDGKTLLEARQRIQRLQGVLKNGRLLTIQDQQQAKMKLEAVMDAILNKSDSTEIQAQLLEIETFVKGQQTSGEQYVTNLQALKQRIEAMPAGKLLREKMVFSLTELQEKIETGQSPSWDSVQKQLDSVQLEADEMDLAYQEFSLLDTEKQTILLPRLDQARNIDEFKAIMAEGRSIIPKQIREIFQPEETGERPEWQRFTLTLQWRRLTVAAVVYFFTLFVGWITLYASSPTFGANREDYITLFLWGVASNVVGGQAVDIKSIVTRQGDSSVFPGQ